MGIWEARLFLGSEYHGAGSYGCLCTELIHGPQWPCKILSGHCLNSRPITSERWDGLERPLTRLQMYTENAWALIPALTNVLPPFAEPIPWLTMPNLTCPINHIYGQMPLRCWDRCFSVHVSPAAMTLWYVPPADLELECLATWKDGSDMYLYGRFSGPGVVDKDSAYRCFVSTQLSICSHSSSWAVSSYIHPHLS